MTSQCDADDRRLLHSCRAAARRLGVRRDTIAQLLRDGVLRAVPCGRQLRIPEAELQRLAREGWTDESALRPPRPPPRGGKRRAAFAEPGALRRTRVQDL